MEHLPYISAIIKEGLRWRPTVPVTPQHRLTQDLEFEGYRHPAGLDFMVNSRAVCAGSFLPDRYHSVDTTLLSSSSSCVATNLGLSL